MTITNLAAFGKPNIVIDTSRVSMMFANHGDYKHDKFGLTVVSDGCPLHFYFAETESALFKGCFAFLEAAMKAREPS